MAAAAMLGSGCLIAFDGLQATSDSTRVTLWSLSLVLVSLVALVLAGQREGPGLGFSRMRVGAWFPAWLGFSFGVTSLAWRERPLGLSLTITQADVVAALIVLHFALAAWTLGYLLGPGSLLTKAGGKLANGLAPGDDYA
nr:hypothetical protein [Micromonospora sp. DSM 115978]